MVKTNLDLGVSVATMAIGKAGAKNAGILAAQILGIKFPEIREKVKAYKDEIAQAVIEKNKRLSAIRQGESASSAEG